MAEKLRGTSPSVDQIPKDDPDWGGFGTNPVTLFISGVPQRLLPILDDALVREALAYCDEQVPCPKPK
jgi:hypothetical protein